MLDIAEHIGVVRVDAELLLAAGDENAGPRHDQRPQRPKLRFRQRMHGVIGANGGQDEEGVAIGVMQQRRAGDGEIGGHPATNQVAEIDDAVRHRPSARIGAAHHIVVGDVVVDGLQAQMLGERLDAAHRANHGLGNAVPRLLVLDRGQEMQRHLSGPAQIPLQVPVEAGMVEIGEIGGDAARQRAERGDRPFAEISALRQRFAVEIAEQTHLIFLAADGEKQDFLAIAGLDQFGHARGVGLAGQMPHGGVLRFQFDGGVFDAADFQHIAALAGIEAIIAVLLASQFGDCAFQAVEAVEDCRRLFGRDIRPRQLRALKERVVRHV